MQQEELISGYLDGELSKDEAAHVAHLLATDQECRDTLASLEALREAVQAYPHEELGKDLSSSVMARLGIAAVTPKPATQGRRFRDVFAAVAAAAAILFIIRQSVPDAWFPFGTEANVTDSDDDSDKNKDGDKRDLAGNGTNGPKNSDGRSTNQDAVSPKNGTTPSDGGRTKIVTNDDPGLKDDDIGPRKPVIENPLVKQGPNVKDPLVNPTVENPAVSQADQFTAVYDVVVSGPPSKDGWLRTLLTECNIDIRKGVVSVDDKVAKAIQAGLLAGVIPADLTPDTSENKSVDGEDKSAVRLVYVRARGRQLDKLYNRLHEAKSSEVELIMPGIAIGVETHLLRATKVQGAAAVVLGLGADAAEEFIASRPKEAGISLVGDAGNMFEAGGVDELYGLLIILRTAASVE